MSCMCGKELISQFERILFVSTQTSKSSDVNKSLHKTQRTARRKRKSRVKKTFRLRPSKLNIVQQSEQNFSFEKCSKELESIISTSSSVGHNHYRSVIRPRSSSLPSTPTSSQSSIPGRRQESPHSFVFKKQNVKSQRKAEVSSKETEKMPGPSKPIKKRKTLNGKRDHRALESSCAQQARNEDENISYSIDRLTDYLEESILLPKKMSYMAEMMYT